MNKKIFSLLILMLTGTVFAVPSARFHADFNKDFSAASHNGSVAGKHSQEVLWENLATYLKEGVEDKGALIGTGKDGKADFHIQYPNKNFITAKSGSVVFWIRPEDWNGKDRKFHIFFRAEGKDADLLIYKVPWGNNLCFLIGPTRKSGGKHIWSTVTAPTPDWTPGEWHFIAAAWGNGKMKLYIDGFCKKQGKLSVPGSEFTRFGIGGLRPTKWTTPQNHSVIDEVMLYNTMLTDADVLERYKAYKQSKIVAADETKVKPVGIRSSLNAAGNAMEFNFSVKEVSRSGKFYSVACAVYSSKGKCVVKKVINAQSTEYQWNVPLKSLKPDDYTLRLTVQKSNPKLNKAEVFAFTVPKRPEVWRSTDAGKAQTAPAPWHAPRWNKSKAEFICWNRSYVFGKSLLPEQIFSGREKLLSRPAVLTLNGAKVNGGRLKVKTSNGERIDLAGSTSAGNFTVKSKMYGEFDGFLWFEVAVTPKNKSAVIKSLTLDFPFNKAQSQLFNAMVKQYIDYVPGHSGKFKKYALDLFSNTSRTMFVGNDEVGFEWFCEDMCDWKLRRQADSLQLLPGRKENILRLNMVNMPLAPGRTYRYRFGIQALPVKPFPANWRAVRLMHPGKNSHYPFFPWSEVHNIPDPDRKHPDFDKRVKKAAKYEHLNWYFAGFTNSPDTKEWSFYGSEWSQTPPAVGTIGAANSKEWKFARNCPAGDGYIDYYVHNLRRTVRKLNILHLYFDNQDAQFCSNPRHNCAWKGQDGNSYRRFNLLATRELVKRIYKMFKQERPNGTIIRHMSTKSVTPVLGFADMIADGEMYCGTVGREEHYKSIFAPDMFRAMFMSAPYGIPRYYIPQFQRAISLHSPIKNRYPNAWSHKHLDNHRAVLRHFKGYMYVHDALIWQSFGVRCGDWYKIQDQFGFDGNEKFVLYTDKATPFTAPGQVMVSSYSNKGKMLIIIMNDSKKSGPVTVKVSPAKLAALKVKLGKLVNAETGKKIKFDGKKFIVDIPAKDYAIIKNY